MRTSERLSVPATSHCSFAKLTVKTVAKEQLDDQPRARAVHSVRRSSASLGLGAARESVARLLGRSVAGRPPFAKRCLWLAERGLDRLDVVGWSDDAGAGLADQVGGGAVRRHEREDRRSAAARYSKTLPERTPLPRPPASVIRSSSASESRCSSSAAWRGA